MDEKEPQTHANRPQPRHDLTNVDTQTNTATCSHCGHVSIVFRTWGNRKQWLCVNKYQEALVKNRKNTKAWYDQKKDDTEWRAHRREAGNNHYAAHKDDPLWLEQQRIADKKHYQEKVAGNREELDKRSAAQRERYKVRMENKETMSMGDVTKLLKVSARTVRRLERDNILMPCAITPIGNHRVYQKADVLKVAENITALTAAAAEDKPTNYIPKGFDLIQTYEQLREYTVAFGNGDIPFLFLVGSPGSGKSRQIQADIAAYKHVWIDNHVTNLGLYIKAYEADGAPIVMDDVNHFITTKQSCSLIKSLTQSEKEKSVSWENPNLSVLQERDIPTNYKTTSPICLIGNRWDARNADFQAIQDRALAVAFFPNAETIHMRVFELGWCDDDVCEFIGENLANIPQPSMREYYNGMLYKKITKDWQKKLVSKWEAMA